MEEARASAPTVTLVDGGIHIDFSGFWNRNISEYNFFSMSRKRNFAGMAERSAEALAALLADPDFAFGLAALRYTVSLPEGDPDYIGEDELAAQVVRNSNGISHIACRLLARLAATADVATAAEMERAYIGFEDCVPMKLTSA